MLGGGELTNAAAGVSHDSDPQRVRSFSKTQLLHQMVTDPLHQPVRLLNACSCQTDLSAYNRIGVVCCPCVFLVHDAELGRHEMPLLATRVAQRVPARHTLASAPVCPGVCPNAVREPSFRSQRQPRFQ